MSKWDSAFVSQKFSSFPCAIIVFESMLFLCCRIRVENRILCRPSGFSVFFFKSVSQNTGVPLKGSKVPEVYWKGARRQRCRALAEIVLEFSIKSANPMTSPLVTDIFRFFGCFCRGVPVPITRWIWRGNFCVSKLLVCSAIVPIKVCL